MANNGLSSTTFLDALILLLVANTDNEATVLIDQLCDCYNEEFKQNSSMDTLLNRKFVALLLDVKKVPKGEEHDIERTKLVADFITKNQPIDDQDDIFFGSLKQIFDDTKKVKSDPKFCKNTKQKVRNTLTWNKYRKLCNQMFSKLNTFSDITDDELQSFCLSDINNIARRLVESTSFSLDQLPTGAEERVIFSDRESLTRAFQKLTEEETVGILKTGLQGFNRMCGYRGGLARGEFVVIYGLQHHFKTGLLLTVARGICGYNDPKAHVTPGKKPLILFISLENYARKNLYWFYKTAYATCYQKSPDPKMPLTDMIKFVQEWYLKTGWEFIIERYKGKDFGYDQFTETIERYESLGYEVVVCLVDYMEKMKKASTTKDSGGKSWLGLGELADNIFGYIKSKEILFITPHQFNRDMMKIAEQGRSNVIKSFGTSGVSGSISVAQAADLEIYVYIEKDHTGQPWLTVLRGKHRYVDNTKDAHKYFAYPFDLDLGIVDDINGKPQFVSDIYAIDTEKVSTAPTSVF